MKPRVQPYGTKNISGANIERLRKDSFKGCSALEKIVCPRHYVPVIEDAFDSFAATVYVPEGMDNKFFVDKQFQVPYMGKTIFIFRCFSGGRVRRRCLWHAGGSFHGSSLAASGQHHSHHSCGE